MYLSHFELSAKPFAERAGAEFYYPAEGHQAALHKLRYALEDAGGAAALAGPSGCGKSLLVNALCRRLSEAFAPPAICTYPQLDPEDFLAWLARELSDATLDAHISPEQSLRRIERALGDRAADGKWTLLVIDEAQLLDPAGTLETLRLLLNLGGDERPLALLLVGQPLLLPLLARRPEVEERLALHCILKPFSPAETAAYIEHRLRAAGARRAIFRAEALDAVFEASQGIPRRINRVCDLSLLVAFAEERHEIAAEDVHSVCAELLPVGQ